MPKFVIYLQAESAAIGHCVVGSADDLKVRDGVIYIPTDDDIPDVGAAKWAGLADRYAELWPDLAARFCPDPAAALAQAKSSRKVRIKSEAASLIASLDWKVTRAQEREAAGWTTLAEVDAVLAEREAIRRSSSAAEAAVDALTDVASVQAFTWSVDVIVPAPRRLTQTKFAGRFTDGELQAIIAAADANAALKAWWTKFELADDINLDDPATRAGVQALEIAGVIGTGRAAEILA